MASLISKRVKEEAATGTGLLRDRDRMMNNCSNFSGMFRVVEDSSLSVGQPEQIYCHGAGGLSYP